MSDRGVDGSSCAVRESAGQVPVAAPRYGVVKLAVGLSAVLLLFVLGACARLAGVTRWGLRIDESIAFHGRTTTLTAVANTFTTIATPEVVGVAAIVVLPLALAFGRRRLDAVRALCILGGALALAWVAKALIAEHRPPAALWAAPADSGASYPSGHTTVAAAIAVILVVVAWTRVWRAVALVVGGLYTLGVAVSRVYLANHYPIDVVASVICALAAGLVVSGLAALPAVHRRLARFDTVRPRQEPAR